MISARRRRVDFRAAHRLFAWLTLGVLSAGAVMWSHAAHAAQFTLAPTRVNLTDGQVAQTLVLGNEAASEVSFELSFQRWRMDEKGEWLLEPSDDLILHPQIVTVPGKGKAVIRVGTLSTQRAQEQAYRIQMQELPGERDVQGAAVAMLTRISVPVFVQVAKPELALALDEAVLSDSAVSMRLNNVGTRYLSPEDARLIVRDAKGEAVHEDSVGVPYLLVGTHIVLSRPFTAEACRRADSVDLVFPEAGITQTLSLKDGERRCGG